MVLPTATSDEVRSAYRRIALQNHPDQSKDPRSPAIFLAATAAYEVLGDVERRAAYDATLAAQEQREAKREARRVAEPPPTRTTSVPRPSATPSTAAEVARLSVLFSQGRHAQAETLARKILDVDSRQPVPYAILGDLARSRGQTDEAARLYAYAAQFDPRNPVYQRRYEEILSGSRIVYGKLRYRIEEETGQPVAAYVSGGVVTALAGYVVIGRETPLLPMLDVVSTWTFGLVVTLFLAGVAMGVGLGVSKLLDRFSGFAVTTSGRIGPVLALAGVSIFCYWAAALLYVVLGFSQRAFSFSVSRFMFGVGMVTSLFALSATFSPTISTAQVFLWGGNIVYVGCLLGWLVADAFRA